MAERSSRPVWTTNATAAMPRTRKTGLKYGEHFVTEYGLYALVQQPLLERVTLNGGVRLNHGSMYGDVVIPQAGVAVRLDDATTRERVGRARFPESDDPRNVPVSRAQSHAATGVDVEL